ncbi:MAG TPA: hypothetical protein VD978_06475 [Azospirillum sp.]|nr:hypothetical protein [Azospirillum sp.]
MDGILGASPAVFVGLTLVVFGGCAWLTGQTLGQGWKPLWAVFAYSALLGAGDRFLVYGLFGGELLSLWGYVLHTVVLALIVYLSYRMAMTNRMVRQYPWLYQRMGPFGWRERHSQQA